MTTRRQVLGYASAFAAVAAPAGDALAQAVSATGSNFNQSGLIGTLESATLATTMPTAFKEAPALAELVRRIIDFHGQILWDTSKPDGTPRKLLDSSRIFALGWKPKVDLESGIRVAYESAQAGTIRRIEAEFSSLPKRNGHAAGTDASADTTAKPDATIQ